ncbi:MAG: class I SAM-dependent methyltransferase [Thermoplasmatota archaeon]
MLQVILGIAVLILLIVIILHTAVRIVRFFYKFPMPQFLANIIDNPLRRAIQPPEKTALRHGLRKGMKVLEVGPGNGRYTIAAAKVVGPDGLIVTIDIEEKMIKRVIKRVTQENITNVRAEVANVYELPYEDSFFDIIYMIAVINEIPEQERAFQEFHRVLKSDGVLVFSELLMDPDYRFATTLIKKVENNGFRVKEKIGNVFYYTLKFVKV